MFPPLKYRVFRLFLISFPYPGAKGISTVTYDSRGLFILSPGLLVRSMRHRHIELLYYTHPRVSIYFCTIFLQFPTYFPSHYIIIVYIVPLQELYTIFGRDTVDWFYFPFLHFKEICMHTRSNLLPGLLDLPVLCPGLL